MNCAHDSHSDGQGRASRDEFAYSALEDQKAIVAFLKTLQIVPQVQGKGPAAHP